MIIKFIIICIACNIGLIFAVHLVNEFHRTDRGRIIFQDFDGINHVPGAQYIWQYPPQQFPPEVPEPQPFDEPIEE